MWGVGVHWFHNDEKGSLIEVIEHDMMTTNLHAFDGGTYC